MSRLESNQRKITGFDGIERIYTFEPLTVAEAADVEHDLWDAVSKIAGNFGDSAVTLFSDVGSDGLKSSDFASLFKIPAAVLNAVPKKSLKHLAKSLLSGAVVDGPEVHTLIDGWTDPYLRGRWPERVDAIVAAIDVSYPSYFSLARVYLRDLFARLGLTSSTANAIASRKG